MKYEKIVFVSKDGTFRAPIAAAIMRKKLRYSVSVEARGLVVLFPEPINPKGVATAVGGGYNPKETVSKVFTEEDCGISTLVLVMTEKMKQQIYDNFKKAVNVYSLKEFAGGQGDIETPFGRNMGEYNDCFLQLEEWVLKTAELLNSKDA